MHKMRLLKDFEMSGFLKELSYLCFLMVNTSVFQDWLKINLRKNIMLNA